MRCSSCHAVASTERGWSIPSALVASILVAYGIIIVTSEALSLLRRTQSFAQGDALRAAVIDRVVSTPLPAEGCDTVSANVRGVATTTSRCVESEPQFESSPPVSLPAMIVDYDSLFQAVSECPGIVQPSTHTSFTAPTAPYTCIPFSRRYPSLLSLDNLYAESLSIESPSQQDATLVATPGTLTVAEELTLTASTLMVTGGHTSIASIRYDGDTPIRITIVSARGDITVGNIRGKISLLAINRGEREVPATSFLPPFPLPPLRPRRMYGMTWGGM